MIMPRSLGGKDRMLHVVDTTLSNCTQLQREAKNWLFGLECIFPWISAFANGYGDVCAAILELVE